MNLIKRLSVLGILLLCANLSIGQTGKKYSLTEISILKMSPKIIDTSHRLIPTEFELNSKSWTISIDENMITEVQRGIKVTGSSSASNYQIYAGKLLNDTLVNAVLLKPEWLNSSKSKFNVTIDMFNSDIVVFKSFSRLPKIFLIKKN